MNPKERLLHPLEATEFVDGPAAASRLMWPGRREASLATIPERSELLQRVVRDLVPQVDLLRVYLNGHHGVPGFLRSDKIVVEHSDDHGDRGDAGKFFWCEKAKGYQFVCDDDIVYPADYGYRLVRAIERYSRLSAVGFHGAIFRERMSSYYRDRNVLHMNQDLGADRAVHLLGTGVLGYHAPTVRVQRDAFRVPNMADVWFALHCQRQRIPRVVLGHRGKWLRIMKTRTSICDRARGRDAVQTKALKVEWPWKLIVPQQLRRSGGLS
jgi:hypothetical protein